METAPHGSMHNEEYRTHEIDGKPRKGRPRPAVQPGQHIASTTYVLKPLQADPSISDGGPSLSVPRLSPSGITIISPRIVESGNAITPGHHQQPVQPLTLTPTGNIKHISQSSEFIHSGSNFVNSSNSSVGFTSGSSIKPRSNSDNTGSLVRRRLVSEPVVRSGREATDIVPTYSQTYTGLHYGAQHVTCLPDMTRLTTGQATSHSAQKLTGQPVSANRVNAEDTWSIRRIRPALNLIPASNMMLSPNASEIGMLNMDSDSRTSSRTSTPTMVRTRPRLPTGLMRPKDLFSAMAVSCGNLTPPRAIPGPRTEDIACDFNSLGRTDFVRKYSTKVRSNTDPIPRANRPQSPGLGTKPSSLPASTQNTFYSMPGGDMERDRSTRPHTLGGLTPTRTRSVKLKLEKLREARRSSDINPDGLKLDNNVLASLIRKDSSSPETQIIGHDSCDKDGPQSPLETTGPMDTYCKTGENNIPRGQLQKLHISHSHPPMGEERRFHTFPGRRSASPVVYTESPSDKEVGQTVSKTVASDRRLCHQDAMDKVSMDRLDQPILPSHVQTRIVINPVTSSNIYNNVSATTECPTRLTRPAVVHWQLGRDSVDSDRSTPPGDHTHIMGNDSDKKGSDIAEDEGVGEIDLAPDDSYTVQELPSGPRRGPWNTPDIIKGTLGSDQDGSKDSCVENVVCGTGKLPNGRFSTHPPSKERSSAIEAGSMDSNGFGALRETKLVEELTPEELELKLSTVSIDSQSCIGDLNYSTYHEVVQDVTADGTNIDSNLERKNSKSLKQKSKSDPCGEKQKESLRMPPTIDVHVQSTPMLTHADDTPKSVQEISGSLQVTSQKPTSVSDSALAYTGQGDQGPEILQDSEPTTPPESAFMIKAHRSSSRKRNNRANREANKNASPTEETIPTNKENTDFKITPITSIMVESDGDLPSSDSQTPEGTLEKGATIQDSQLGPGLVSLTLPYSKGSKNTSLTRSQSSASVFLSKAEAHRHSSHSPGSSRQKDLVKRRPHFLDHLGQSVTGNLDKSSHKRDPSWTTGYFPSLEPIYAQSSLSLFEGADEEKDKRDLIVQEFYSTEEQYVEALQMLVERYMIPMKTRSVVDGNLVDDIFYKVNEIYMHHATFLTFLGKALQVWDNTTSTIGDIIHKNFSKQTVIESYVSFIENFPRAEKVLDEISTKSSFQKFIEICERENKMRLPLKAHIVKPAQRIPRYELLLKRLLDNTPDDHPDHTYLVDAEKSIHQLALRINSAKESRQEEDYQDTLKRLELLLITDLAVADRTYIRHDMIQILSRKDQCCIWLFSDLAVFSSVKRKSGPVNRKTTLLLQSPTGNDFVENCKHKMWLKISLEDLEIVQLETSPIKKPLVDKDVLENDVKLLDRISGLTDQLDCDHTTVEEAVNDLILQMNKQLAEHQRKSPPPEANKVELMANTTEGLEHLVLVFPSQDKRTSWEVAFAVAKRKLAALAEGKPPEFQQALAITKTRAGMQFSCAAPIDGFNEKHFHDVWVCNSDGYVGHMCLLSLQPEPIVTLNTPLPGCNSRILCICAVPALHGAHQRKNSRRRLGVTPTILVQRAESDSIQLRHRRRADYQHSPIVSQSSTSDTDSSGYSATEEDEPQSRKISTGSRSKLKLSSSPPPASPNIPDSKALDPKKSTMWLGTEDGCILVFPSTDNLKTTKNKIKLQQNAAVSCLCYIEFKVFASLANGDIIVYNNKPDGTWDMTNPVTMTVGSGTVGVSKLLAVAGRLWCACQHEIYIVNPQTLDVEVSFTGNPDAKKPIQCMATFGLGVWVACQQSAKVSLFHGLSHQLLGQVNVAQTVAHKLQNADDIIRQHKTACLRITSLVTCKDQLWIGTSAGVILTMPLPKISQASEKNSVTLTNLIGLSHGHTGHVRFLTCVDMSSKSRRSTHQDEYTTSDGTPATWPSRRMSIGLHNFNISTKMLVISGGDGYEDFRSVAPNESTGRDDSTNHLLLWQV